MSFDFSSKVQVPDFASAFQNSGQGVASLGQSLGGGAQQLIAKAKEREKQKQWASAVDQMVKANPNLAPYAGILAQNRELAGQVLPGLIKPKDAKNWSPVPGMVSKKGNTIFYNRTNPTEEIEGTVPGVSTGYGNTMAPIRKAQYTLQDLPSNQGPNTAGGAAYQVKVASRQGKSLIAKASTPQALSLASADLGRAVQRSAPLAETIGASNFADNLMTKYNLLTQKLTADPSSKDVPKIRKEIYQMFDELDKAATPWVSNQLDYMDENGFTVSQKTRRKQMGMDIPDVPFIDLTGETNPAAAATGSYSDPGKEARYQAWKKANGQ